MSREASKLRKRFQASGEWDKYFKHDLLDIGCGDDLIDINSVGFDREQGDAQLLTNIPNESFETVFSAHCIEHMRDPRVAIQNWWRVLKPGGYMIIAGPDEDLYECGMFPSIANDDHKITLTLSKQKSWSPVSVNLLDLVRELPNHKLIRAEIVDTGYRYELRQPGRDQTALEDIEAGVEVVVQKVSNELPFQTVLRDIMLCPKCGRLELKILGRTMAGLVWKLMCMGCGEFLDYQS